MNLEKRLMTSAYLWLIPLSSLNPPLSTLFFLHFLIFLFFFLGLHPLNFSLTFSPNFLAYQTKNGKGWFVHYGSEFLQVPDITRRDGIARESLHGRHLRPSQHPTVAGQRQQYLSGHDAGSTKQGIRSESHLTTPNKDLVRLGPAPSRLVRVGRSPSGRSLSRRGQRPHQRRNFQEWGFFGESDQNLCVR